MVEGLNDMLKVLSTDEAQLRFLKRIPNPDQQVADLLIYKFENEQTILDEAESLKQSGDIEGYEELAKKSVDLSIQRRKNTFFDRSLSLTEVLLKWRDPTITRYTIEKIDDLSNEDQSVQDKGNLLWQTVRFAQNNDEEALRTEQLEKLLFHEMAEGENYASVLKELGRFSEAIEEYLAEGGIYLEEETKALELAKVHAPEKVKEIAKKIVTGFDFSDCSHKMDLYLECVEISGEDELAVTQLKKQSKNIRDGSQAYRIIPALMRFGLTKEAKKCLKKVEEGYNQSFSRSDEDLRIANLYYEVGETKKALNLFEQMSENIAKRSPFYDKDQKIEVFERLAEIKKDPSILDEAIEICVNDLDYKGCARLAEAQGKYELASKYRSIDKLLEE